MSANVHIHVTREPLEFDADVCRHGPGEPNLVLRVGTDGNTTLFFDRNSAEVIGRRLLRWAAPHLLEPQYPAPQPVVDPFADAYDLAEEARRVALESARLLGGEVQP